MKTTILCFFSLLIFTGCSVKYDGVMIDENNQLQITKLNNDHEKRVKELSLMIQSISNTISQNEAKNLAHTAIYYPMYLANQYELVSPPGYQNYLINQKEKSRGLCYHWVIDILEYIDRTKYPNIQFYRVVANKGEYFEHNAISVTAKQMPYEQGILLDAWRNSGTLFFTPVKEDHRYDWKEREKLQ